MKKIFTVFAAMMLFSVMFTGCGDNPSTQNDTKIGMIRHLNASEEEFTSFTKIIAETFSLQMKTYTPIFYDNLQSMLMALDAGEIGVISTYDCVARYLIAQNPDKYELLVNDSLEFIDALCFMLLEENEVLRDDIDLAIENMRNDGTLDKLTNEYIVNFTVEDPPFVEMPRIEGAGTLKIAVTGDLPPIDLVRADGTSAGFNTALVVELSKRLNKNVEIVYVDSAARASALTSGRVDVVFWAIVPINQIIPLDSDQPVGTIISAPYYGARVAHVKLKS